MSVTPKLWIRHAQEKDIDSLRKLSDYRNFTKLPEDEEILVAEENGMILGAVSARHKKIRYIPSASKLRFFRIGGVETNAWVYRLFVREDRRSMGLGKKLVKNMATHLHTKGIKTLYAGIAPGPYKEISRRAFLAAGFEDVGCCICVRRPCVGNLLMRAQKVEQRSDTPVPARGRKKQNTWLKPSKRCLDFTKDPLHACKETDNAVNCAANRTEACGIEEEP